MAEEFKIYFCGHKIDEILSVDVKFWMGKNSVLIKLLARSS